MERPRQSSAAPLLQYSGAAEEHGGHRARYMQQHKTDAGKSYFVPDESGETSEGAGLVDYRRGRKA